MNRVYAEETDLHNEIAGYHLANKLTFNSKIKGLLTTQYHVARTEILQYYNVK